MSLTAKEFSKLPHDEQQKRYVELNQHEASLYRIFYAPIGGKKSEPQKPSPGKYSLEERERADRQLFDCMKKFHTLSEDITFEEWRKQIQYDDNEGES